MLVLVISSLGSLQFTAATLRTALSTLQLIIPVGSVLLVAAVCAVVVMSGNSVSLLYHFSRHSASLFCRFYITFLDNFTSLFDMSFRQFYITFSRHFSAKFCMIFHHFFDTFFSPVFAIFHHFFRLSKTAKNSQKTRDFS